LYLTNLHHVSSAPAVEFEAKPVVDKLKGAWNVPYNAFSGTASHEVAFYTKYMKSYKLIHI
jgi:hypothetical protein